MCPDDIELHRQKADEEERDLAQQRAEYRSKLSHKIRSGPGQGPGQRVGAVDKSQSRREKERGGRDRDTNTKINTDYNYGATAGDGSSGSIRPRVCGSGGKASSFYARQLSIRWGFAPWVLLVRERR
jgi:hypothetical protein